jgi:hypothetical protein
MGLNGNRALRTGGRPPRATRQPGGTLDAPPDLQEGLWHLRIAAEHVTDREGCLDVSGSYLERVTHAELRLRASREGLTSHPTIAQRVDLGSVGLAPKGSEITKHGEGATAQNLIGQTHTFDAPAS